MRHWLTTVAGPKPADSVLNTAVWQGDAPLPLDPWGFRAGCRRGGGRGAPPEPRPHPRPCLSGGGARERSPGRWARPALSGSSRRAMRSIVDRAPSGDQPSRHTGPSARRFRRRVIRALARKLSGIEGARPSPAQMSYFGYAGLTTLAWLKPARADASKTPLRAPPEQHPPSRRGQAPRPRDRQPRGRRGRPTPFTPWRRRHSLTRRRVPPYP